MYLLRSDWFFGLSASVVIGQSDCFGFGFTISLKKWFYKLGMFVEKVYKHTLYLQMIMMTYLMFLMASAR